MGANKKLNHEDVQQYVTEDLVAKIDVEKAEIKKLEFHHAVSTLDNPLSIRAKRRNVARLITELNRRKNEK